MSDNKISGNYYKTDKVEPTPDECPNCMYQNKNAKKDLEECPNCHYVLNKGKKEEKE